MNFVNNTKNIKIIWMKIKVNSDRDNKIKKSIKISFDW